MRRAATAPAAGDEIDGVVARPGRIHAWLATAQAGDVFAYATRTQLPPAAPGAALMRDLQATGLVNLTRRIAPVDGDGDRRWTYLAQRTSLRLTRARRAILGAEDAIEQAVAEVPTETIDLVLDRIRAAIRLHRPCPADRLLAQLARVEIATIRAAIEQLHRDRVIDVVRPARGQRIITLVASTRRTAG